MKRKLSLLLSCLLFMFITVPFAGVPQNFSYQGYITDSQSNPLNGLQLVRFNLYSDSDGDSLLWSSDYQTIEIQDGYFNILLGSLPMDPLPENIFKDNNQCYLGITVGVDPQMPLIPLSSSPYSFHAQTADIAESAIRSRDLYHNIMDVNPNSVTSFYFIAHDSNPQVTLYLYGDEFQGALPEHSHSGNNAHTHEITGTISSTSVSHTHSFSGTTASSNASHSHTASAGNYNLAHTHSGTTGSTNLSHTHTGTTTNGGAHGHWFRFTGAGQTGPYLVHSNDLDGLSTSPIERDSYARLSVVSTNSEHSHSFTTQSALGNHTHSFTTGSWGGNHSHSISVNSASAAHTHTYSGTTGANDINHGHSFTGSASSTGDGLSYEGVSDSSLPSSVSIYIDDSFAAGPFTGEFASGALDLSSYVLGEGEHLIELREEGGTGGRLIYNLFVE